MAVSGVGISAIYISKCHGLLLLLPTTQNPARCYINPAISTRVKHTRRTAGCGTSSIRNTEVMLPLIIEGHSKEVTLLAATLHLRTKKGACRASFPIVQYVLFWFMPPDLFDADPEETFFQFASGMLRTMERHHRKGPCGVRCGFEIWSMGFCHAAQLS